MGNIGEALQDGRDGAAHELVAEEYGERAESPRGAGIFENMVTDHIKELGDTEVGLPS